MTEKLIGMAAAVLLWAMPAQAVVVAGSDASGEAGETVELSFFLDSGGARVAGVQNDVEIRAPLLLESADDCVVNPAIGKEGHFQLGECEIGPDCVRLRAVVLSLDDVDEIPDGSVLYRCQIGIRFNAPNHLYRVPVIGAGASDPDGNTLPAEGLAGRVAVGEDPNAIVQLDNVEAKIGSFATLHARYTGFVDVVTLTSYIALSDAVQITSTVDDQPSCRGRVAGAETQFEFIPLECTVGSTCEFVLATISASTPLPLAEPLFECTIFPRAVVPGSYVIDCPASGGGGSDGEVVDVGCQSGILLLQADSTPTATPTGGPPAATPTFTAAVVATITPTPRHGDDGGCQTVPPSAAASALPLLGPALALAWAMRRTRRGASSPRSVSPR